MLAYEELRRLHTQHERRHVLRVVVEGPGLYRLAQRGDAVGDQAYGHEHRRAAR